MKMITRGLDLRNPVILPNGLGTSLEQDEISITRFWRRMFWVPGSPLSDSYGLPHFPPWLLNCSEWVVGYQAEQNKTSKFSGTRLAVNWLLVGIDRDPRYAFWASASIQYPNSCLVINGHDYQITRRDDRDSLKSYQIKCKHKNAIIF